MIFKALFIAYLIIWGTSSQLIFKVNCWSIFICWKHIVIFTIMNGWSFNIEFLKLFFYLMFGLRYLIFLIRFLIRLNNSFICFKCIHIHFMLKINLYKTIIYRQRLWIIQIPWMFICNFVNDLWVLVLYLLILCLLLLILGHHLFQGWFHSFNLPILCLEWNKFMLYLQFWSSFLFKVFLV